MDRAEARRSGRVAIHVTALCKLIRSAATNGCPAWHWLRCALRPGWSAGRAPQPLPNLQEIRMKMIVTALMCSCMALAAGTAFAEDSMKKEDPMAKDSMMKKDMTMQECKDHMAMPKKDGMAKDDAMMKKDTQCAAMMKKDDAMMKKDEPMKK
jgi:hypothetical protein